MAAPSPKPVLQKPPGYRDPANPVQPKPRPIGARKPVLPRSFRAKRQRRGYCRCCCCVFCIIILILIFTLIVAAALVYFVYDPHPPVFHLQSFRTPKFHVTNNPDGAYLDADTVMRLEVKNPNSKMLCYFDDISFEITTDNGNVNLGSKTLPGFTLKEKEVRSLKVETSVKGQPLNDEQAKNLKGRFQSKKIAPSVDVRTKAGIGLQGWKVGTLGIDVACGDVSLKNLEGGATPKCNITLLKWIKVQ